MARLRVEVVYAVPGRADCTEVVLPANATVRDALLASGLCERHPEIDPDTVKLGVYGTPCEHHARLADGDRVEVYRPLAVDPKEARRARARARATSRRTSR